MLREFTTWLQSTSPAPEPLQAKPQCHELFPKLHVTLWSGCQKSRHLLHLVSLGLRFITQLNLRIHSGHARSFTSAPPCPSDYFPGIGTGSEPALPGILSTTESQPLSQVASICPLHVPSSPLSRLFTGLPAPSPFIHFPHSGQNEPPKPQS